MKEGLAELLYLAKHAASVAATIHRRAIDSNGCRVETKGSTSDLVTEIDRQSEKELVRIVLAARPNDEIIGEEGSHLDGNSGVRWILDPLDGTTNFIHRYPAHSVAVGVEVDGCRRIGVVHDNFSNRVYAGVVGEGATLNNESIVVRNERNLEHALIGTGFLPDKAVRRAQADLLKLTLPIIRDIRRSGCPSLDICNVASGTLDGLYECGLGLWDITAAAAIAEAAGATVTLLKSNSLPNPFLIVANTELTFRLVDLFVDAGVVEEPES